MALRSERRLALLDPDQHALLSCTAYGAGFVPPRYQTVAALKIGDIDSEQPANFLDTQHRWQFAWKARQDQAPRQIRPVERYVEEEAQR